MRNTKRISIQQFYERQWEAFESTQNRYIVDNIVVIQCIRLHASVPWIYIANLLTAFNDILMACIRDVFNHHEHVANS